MCLAVGNALARLALAPLDALGAVSHGPAGRAGGLVARAHRLLLASRVVVRPEKKARGLIVIIVKIIISFYSHVSYLNETSVIVVYELEKSLVYD